MKGLVFDIQRFSVHDGPGIRTTIFMKGCPLRCRWCHNPEGLIGKIQLQYFLGQCIQCGSCGDKEQLSDAQKCPAEALKVCGKELDEDEVLQEVMRDRMFYGNDGGITFSGGECLLQADFVASVLRRVQTKGLHTAIDTSGCVAWTEIYKTLEYCDLYLYDIKCMDSGKHKEYTGVDNILILENLKRLSDVGKDIWIRVPVIPGFNNNELEMTAIAERVSSLSSVKNVTLMPYHVLGVSKYETLGMVYPFDTTARITDIELAVFQEIFQKRNIMLQ